MLSFFDYCPFACLRFLFFMSSDWLNISEMLPTSCFSTQDYATVKLVTIVSELGCNLFYSSCNRIIDVSGRRSVDDSFLLQTLIE